MSEKTISPEKYSTTSPAQTKLNASKSPRFLRKRARNVSQKARDADDRYFNKKVGHRSWFKIGL